MRMRKRKWIDAFLENEKVYLINDGHNLKNIYLEIGMGMGDFITQSALKHPDMFYIGLERIDACVARAIKKAQELELTNLRIIRTDAANLLDIFDEKSIKRLYIHFCDPWPKRKTHKRRLTYPSFLSIYEKLLMDDGDIVFKTDNTDLFNDSIEYFKESPFKIVERSDDYHHDEPKTGYEEKFLNLGVPIHYARLVKKDTGYEENSK